MCKYSIGFQSRSINSCHKINRKFLQISIFKQAELKKSSIFQEHHFLKLCFLQIFCILLYFYSLIFFYKTYQVVQSYLLGYNILPYIYCCQLLCLHKFVISLFALEFSQQLKHRSSMLGVTVVEELIFSQVAHLSNFREMHT